MNREWLAKLKEKGRMVWGIKVILCILIFVWFAKCLYVNGSDEFFTYKNYTYQNELTNPISEKGTFSICQKFVSKGNVLSNITFYFGKLNDSDITLSLLDETGKNIFVKTINPKNYIENEWNIVSVDCNCIKRDKTYSLLLEGRNLSSLTLNNGNTNPKIFLSCLVDGKESAYTLSFGIQSTYRYMPWGYRLQFFISIVIVVGLCLILCVAILKIEKLFYVFTKTEKKSGFWYALYFSVYTVLLFNPLDEIRNKAVEFSRVIGAGFNAGVDVTKRINNFSHWFIFLAVVFVLYFILANYLKSKEYDGENKKIVLLMDNVVIIANIVLGLRCIVFFSNMSQETNVFYYSDYFFILIVAIAIGYVALGIDRKIRAGRFMVINVTAWMLCLPISIVLTREWCGGRSFIGWQYLASGVILIGLFLEGKDNHQKDDCRIELLGISFSFIPFITSIYIEMVTVLNQRNVFWTHIRRNYCMMIVIYIAIAIVISSLYIRKKCTVLNWKNIMYPVLILGFVCLWQQIPISAEYGANMFETANSSVLINDFLQYGDIPIIQHYGGHMMSGVWEGLAYAFINNDFAGAVLSPYAGYIAVVITLAFYFFLKEIWNEDSAVLVVLFFPFYGSVDYWGLGLLAALAAMYYVKKNTYRRAILFWGTCIWCAIYRLDLGFAFIVACIIALAIYMIVDKNKMAFKQLSVSLIGWTILGGIIWFGICFGKQINPVNRLREFLYINLSNQNWAYSSIGDISITKFSFAYIILPFVVLVALLYSIICKKIRENIGKGNWIVLLVLGIAYFYNFSRGLVRHSLMEDALGTCTWSAYVFLAFFVIAKINNRKLFLPIFTMFLLLGTLFQTNANFTEKCISDAAIDKIGVYSETWTVDRFAQEELPEGEIAKTYWEQLGEKREAIKRVNWTPDLKRVVRGYQTVMDALLDDDETFVDMINKTTIYSLINRKNPTYVSQSPLQLSGQFTQEKFVEEIEGIPVVLMPCDTFNDGASEALDGVANAYRYYKVFEYVYQNYVPLCKYEDKFAVWCLPDKYDKMSKKVEKLRTSNDIENILLASDLSVSSAEKVNNADGSFNLQCIGTDPVVWNLQSYFDTTPYIDGTVTIEIEYETDVLGDMQIFYTLGETEDFSEDRVATYTCIANKGTAIFCIPVAEHTKLRFDIPEGSNVKIKAFRLIACDVKLIDYGYDGPYLMEDGTTYSYLPAVHNYNIDKLPVIWAEGDKLNSSENLVMSDLVFNNGYYRYSLGKDKLGTNGNYLKINITYDGTDLDGKIEPNDETTMATLTVGNIMNGNFETKYNYNFIVEEGQHEYMFRISNDYYWYLGETNAVKIESDSQLMNVNMQILEGD